MTGRLGSLSSARKAIVEAEDRFFARYNELSKRNAMDIACRTAAPTGSRLTRRTCQPLLVDDISRNEALGFISVSEGNFRMFPPNNLKFELKAQTLQMLKEDPDLLRALLEHARLVQYYENLRDDKFRNRLVVPD